MRAEECSVRVGNGELKMEGWPLVTGTERKVHTLDRAAAAAAQLLPPAKRV